MPRKSIGDVIVEEALNQQDQTGTPEDVGDDEEMKERINDRARRTFEQFKEDEGP